MGLDLFRFTNPRNKMRMEEGELIENTTSKMWIERYREAGEFTVTAHAATGIRTKLPIGSFVSHVDSDEIMVVEKHQVTANEGESPMVSVSGRSLETILLQRIVGSNKDFTSIAARADYTQPAWYSWIQAESLIARHILEAYVVNSRDAIPYIEVFSTPTGAGTQEARTIDRGLVYDKVMEILAVDNLGIKSIRPGRLSTISAPENCAFVIHRGIDRSKTVSFDTEGGDVYSADYLWSNEKDKNCAFVSGKWVEILVDTRLKSGVDRRILYVDANDIDSGQQTNPTGAARTLIVAAMQARGKEALAKHNAIALSAANVTKGVKQYRFRKHYDLGDLVSVSGDFNETAVQRVTEYFEFEDETGAGGYPTLAADPEEDV